MGPSSFCLPQVVTSWTVPRERGTGLLTVLAWFHHTPVLSVAPASSGASFPCWGGQAQHLVYPSVVYMSQEADLPLTGVDKGAHT